MTVARVARCTRNGLFMLEVKTLKIFVVHNCNREACVRDILVNDSQDVFTLCRQGQQTFSHHKQQNFAQVDCRKTSIPQVGKIADFVLPNEFQKR